MDPANQAGFDNSGESLNISPGLMAKYLEAARQVADHMVLKPEGFDFAPYPMLVETDRERYAIQRIVDFYDRQPTDFADYFQAAWRYKHRAALGQPRATLTTIATENKLSPRYVAMVWQILEQQKEEVGPTVKLQAMWRELPAPKAASPRSRETDVCRCATSCVRFDGIPRSCSILQPCPDSTPTSSPSLCGGTARSLSIAAISTPPRYGWKANRRHRN